MAHLVNLYILLPQNEASTAFLNENEGVFMNIGGQCVCLLIEHPDEENYPDIKVYQLEMSDDIYHQFENQLNGLGAEEARTAEQYLTKYPPKPDLQ